METPNRLIEGTVISNKMDKTVVVKVERKLRHEKYGKVVVRWKKYYAHHNENEIPVGKTVKITQCRPISKLKRFRVVEVI